MYRILLIDDENDAQDACRDTVARMNAETGNVTLEVDIRDTFEGGLTALADGYDAVIIDIKLNGKETGNKIAKTIIERFRVPAAIMTGTPKGDVDSDTPLKTYVKGETSYEEIINDLTRISSTGLFNVLGGTGIIEQIMQAVFWKGLYPYRETWVKKKINGVDTEKALLRYAVTYIQELTNGNDDLYETEEVYIDPFERTNPMTGDIFKTQDGEDGFFVVLSPPCDLAIHDGQIKSDSILICEIEGEEDVCKGCGGKGNVKHLIKNRYQEFYHWLPKSRIFCGGFINFRKVKTLSTDVFIAKYQKPVVKIQVHFIKNILNRLSTYYARQGQPDFDFNSESDIIKARYFT